MTEDKIYVYGDRIKLLRESSSPKLSQEECAQRLNFKTKQAISKIECNNGYITETQLKKLCEMLDCSADYLRGYDDYPKRTEFKRSDGKTVVYEKGFCADSNYSHYMVLIRRLSPRKLCTLDKVLSYLYTRDENGNHIIQDHDLDRFDRLIDAYFTDLPLTYNASTIDYIESHVKNKIMPELTQSAIRNLRSPEYKKLDDYDWNDKDFHNSITQNLGDFMKEANLNFPRALKHSLAESTYPKEDSSIQNITEQAIEYLAECIQVRLKKEVKDNNLYSKRFSAKDYKDIKRNFPKYITRDFSSYLAPWKQLIQEFLEKYEK